MHIYFFEANFLCFCVFATYLKDISKLILITSNWLDTKTFFKVQNFFKIQEKVENALKNICMTSYSLRQFNSIKLKVLKRKIKYNTK